MNYGAEDACNCALKVFVPLFTHRTVPLAVGSATFGKFNQPMTTSLPLLKER